MEINRRSRIFFYIGIIAVIGTVLIFALSGRGIILPHSWLGFLFLVYSEIIFFSGMIAIEHFADKSEKILLRIGCGSVIVIYSLLTFASSLVFTNLPIVNIRLFFMIQILLAVLAVIPLFIFIATSKSVKQVNDGTLSASSRMKHMTDRFMLLKANRQLENEINKLAEDLKFSDISVSVEADDEIEEALTKLEKACSKTDKDIEFITDLIEDTALKIKKRTIQVKSKKAGGL